VAREALYLCFTQYVSGQHLVLLLAGDVSHISELIAKICWRVWGTPANFHLFCI